MRYLSNAFSLNMLSGNATVDVREVSLDQVKDLLSTQFTSAIGHAATSDYIRAVTGLDVNVNRIAITLNHGDQLLVLQMLSRLPEGVVLTQDEVTKIPHKLYLVTVV